MTEPAAEIGHNEQPTELETLILTLDQDNADLSDRTNELVDATERMPKEINDEDLAGKVTDHIRIINAAIKMAEARRKDTKDPYLRMGNTVQSYFVGLLDRLKDAKATALKPLSEYQSRMEAEERARREEAAKIEREKAEKAEADAQTEADINAAVDADEAAKEAEKEAEAKPADLVENRGEYGGHAGRRTQWTFEITDNNAIPLEALRSHFNPAHIEQAIRSYVKAGNRELAGVRIYENTKTVVR